VGLLLGLIAVVISLSSIADATGHHGGGKITARRLAPGAVTAKAIAPGAVGKKALAKSAVTSKSLADDSVNARVLREGAVAGGAVGAPAIAPDAVTKAAIAPGSVYGAALGAESIHMTPIVDADAVASNPEWTPSNTEVTLCGPGEALLGTGFIFTEPGNHEVSFIRAAPFLGSTGNGVTGEIASNSGGTARAQIMAICLGA
jgi:hypothetical protein